MFGSTLLDLVIKTSTIFRNVFAKNIISERSSSMIWKSDVSPET